MVRIASRRRGVHNLGRAGMCAVAVGLTALSAVACDAWPTNPHEDGALSFEIDLSAAMAASGMQQSSAPVPATVMVFWENSKGVFSDTVAVQGSRAPFNLKDLPRGRTTFWAGAASASGTVLYWSQKVVENIDDDFNIGLALKGIFPLPVVTLGGTDSNGGTGPLIGQVNGQTIGVTLANRRAPGDAGTALAAGLPTALNWSVQHGSNVTLSQSSGTLVPGAQVPVNILTAPTNAPISETLYFKFSFGNGADTLRTAVVLLKEADLTVRKFLNGDPSARKKPGPVLVAGDPITWTYIVNNNGHVKLTVTDVQDAVSLPNGTQQTLTPTCDQPLAAELLPGDSLVCMASDTVVLNSYTNVATVRAVSEFGDRLSAQDANYYIGIPGADAFDSINVSVLVNGLPSGIAPGPMLDIGTPITWTYQIQNRTRFPISNVMVRDDRLPRAVCGPLPPIAVGASATCTATGSVAPGRYSTLARITGTSVGDNRVTAEQPSYYEGRVNNGGSPPGGNPPGGNPPGGNPPGGNPPGGDPPGGNPPGGNPPSGEAIYLQAATNGFDADTGPGPDVSVGDSVVWTFLVTNIGTVPLSNIQVSDSNPVVTPVCEPLVGPLQVGASLECRDVGTATAGLFGNFGTAVGTGPTGTVVSATDSSHYEGVNR